MKRAHVQKWAKTLTRQARIESPPGTKGPLRIINLPGVRELERRLLLYGENDVWREDMVARVARELFGISDFDTRFKNPHELEDRLHYSLEARRQVRYLEIQYEGQFEAGYDLTDDELVAVMDKLGFDFRDDNGHPLRCTKLMCRCVEAAAKGIAGKLPDPKSVSLRQFEDGLKRSRDAFLARKRKPTD